MMLLQRFSKNASDNNATAINTQMPSKMCLSGLTNLNCPFIGFRPSSKSLQDQGQCQGHTEVMTKKRFEFITYWSSISNQIIQAFS